MFEMNAITTFLKTFRQIHDRNVLEGYWTNAGNWDLLRKAPRSAWVSWTNGHVSVLCSSVTMALSGMACRVSSACLEHHKKGSDKDCRFPLLKVIIEQGVFALWLPLLAFSPVVLK